MLQQVVAEINLNHLQHNWSLVQQAMGDRFVCAMVKAGAYGHDDILVSKALSKMGCKNFGVCLIDEGIKLRQAGVKENILVFRSFDRQGYQALLENQLTPVVSGWDQIEILKSESRNHKQKIQLHLKFDTGMQRLGFQVQEVEKLYQFFSQNKIYEVQGVMTHLACAEDTLTDGGVTHQQLQDLNSVRQYFSNSEIIYHGLNSGGVLSEYVSARNSEYKSKGEIFKNRFGARPGIMLYGYNPGVPVVGYELKPVMKVKSRPLALRKISVGNGVSYGHRWKAKRPSTIAVIPMGYGDGYPRILTNKSMALYEGQLVPQVGTVCMDYLMLDVSDIEKNPDRQDLEKVEVVLWGDPRLTAYDVAEKAQTISYEILTRLGTRVPRVAVGNIQKNIKDAS